MKEFLEVVGAILLAIVLWTVGVATVLLVALAPIALVGWILYMIVKLIA